MIPGLLGVPKEVVIVKGFGGSNTELSAFDAALVSAKIDNVSLVKLTSILPKEFSLVKDIPKFSPGSTVPAIYTNYVSSNKYEEISAAICLQKTIDGPTLVSEYSSNVSVEESLEKVLEISKLLVKNRNLSVNAPPKIDSIKRTIIEEKFGCVFIGVIYIK
ncbi:MAG: pyruvoyl-dependent arginine decarboxylase [Candidatus Ranarchaeia archaeon]